MGAGDDHVLDSQTYLFAAPIPAAERRREPSERFSASGKIATSWALTRARVIIDHIVNR